VLLVGLGLVCVGLVVVEVLQVVLHDHRRATKEIDSSHDLGLNDASRKQDTEQVCWGVEIGLVLRKDQTIAVEENCNARLAADEERGMCCLWDWVANSMTTKSL
jgi:hypothetical protein